MAAYKHISGSLMLINLTLDLSFVEISQSRGLLTYQGIYKGLVDGIRTLRLPNSIKTEACL